MRKNANKTIRRYTWRGKEFRGDQRQLIIRKLIPTNLMIANPMECT